MRRAALTALGAGTVLLVLPVFDVVVDGAPRALPIAGVVLCLLSTTLWAAAAAKRLPSDVGDPRAWRRFRKNKGALAGAVLVAFVGLVSFVGPILAPHDPDQIFDLGLSEEGIPIGPSAFVVRDGEATRIPLFGAHELPWLDRMSLVFSDEVRVVFPLGADHLGRDQLSRLLFGGRVSLAVALGAVMLAGSFGFCAGLLSGYFRGFADAAVIQLINYVLSLPFLLVAIALNRVIESPSLLLLCVLLGALSWTSLARVTRAKTLSVRELEYVQAARALGMSSGRIIFRHIVPNVLGPAIVIATTLIAQMIIAESAMSFLGLGVKPPTASWGTMLNDGQQYMAYAPRLLMWPAFLIVATVFGFNLLGEGLRDALDPKE